MAVSSLFIASLPTLAVATTCASTNEFSVKLNLDLFKDRQRALDGFYGALDNIQAKTSWFRHSEVHEREHHIEQELGFLDDAQGSFQKAGLQLRFRKRETGTNNWSTYQDVSTEGRVSEIAVKYVSGIRDRAVAFPDQPSEPWVSSYRCKVEGNVYSSGQVLWQATGFVLGKELNSKFVREYPEYTNFTSIDDIDQIFPNISTFVHGEPRQEPLVVSKTQYAYLQDIELWFDDIPTVATVTMVYPSRAAMEVGTPLLNADFEWKAHLGQATWGERSRSRQLMALMNASEYVNHHFTPPYANALKQQQGSPQGVRTWQSTDGVLAGVAALVVLTLLLCGRRMLRRLTPSVGDLEKQIVSKVGAGDAPCSLAQTLLQDTSGTKPGEH